MSGGILLPNTNVLENNNNQSAKFIEELGHLMQIFVSDASKLEAVFIWLASEKLAELDELIKELNKLKQEFLEAIGMWCRPSGDNVENLIVEGISKDIRTF